MWLTPQCHPGLQLSEDLGRIRAQSTRLQEYSETSNRSEVMGLDVQCTGGQHIRRRVVNEQCFGRLRACYGKSTPEDLRAWFGEANFTRVDDEVKMLSESEDFEVLWQAVRGVRKQSDPEMATCPDDQAQNFMVN